jgi:FlaA1/EpsC-like NDP-sugar epimerase
LFFLKQRLEQRSAACKIEYHVADIANRQRMMQIFEGHEIEIVFHAAAYKHVPLMESNVREAIGNNIFGLLSLLDTAMVCGCLSFVAISSDKAVNPTSVMGCTKRVGELILAARPHDEMCCISVRFGNVLGSQGSVVPLFQEQIRKQGRVTVTHPEVTRFFMTVTEAVSLVLQAFAVGRHGEILVLDMGDSVRIVDMVQMLIRLLGKGEDEVEIAYTGLRAGEKLYEELFYKGEDPLPTECGKVMRTRGKPMRWEILKDHLDELCVLVSSNATDDAIRWQLQQIVPEFRGLHEASQSLSVDTPLPVLEAPGVGSD